MVVKRSAIKSKRSKERRNHQLKTKIIFCIIIVFFVLGGISWLAHNEKILINNIQIEETQSIDTEEITRLVEEHLSGHHLWLFPKKNIFIFSKNKLKTDILDKYKQIKNITVKRDGFNTIKITVLERKPFALWCDSEMIVEEEKEEVGDCYFVDYEGYIYATAPYFHDNMYFELYGEPSIDGGEIIKKGEENGEVADGEEKTDLEELSNKKEYIGKHFLPPIEFAKIMQFVNSLEKIEISVYSLTVDLPEMYKLALVSGGVLRFLPPLDYHRSINDLKTAYEKKFSDDTKLSPNNLEYIDTRFENKILFKFKD